MPARAMAFKRFRRSAEKPLVDRGKKGGGFELFRGGYAKCMIAVFRFCVLPFQARPERGSFGGCMCLVALDGLDCLAVLMNGAGSKS